MPDVAVRSDDQSQVVVSLTGGRNAFVLPRPSDAERADAGGGADVPLGERIYSDVIYTREQDMPSLERLLTEHRVLSAVFERSGLSPWRVAWASAIATSFAVGGATLLVTDVMGAEVDSLVAAFVALIGVALLATVAVGLRKPR